MALHTLHYRKWTLTVDREATRNAYAAIPAGGTNECECLYCRNFALARDSGLVYPADVLETLYSLGIDCQKEVEAWEASPERSVWRYYSVWFYFVGSAKRVAEWIRPSVVLREMQLQLDREAEPAGEHIAVRFSQGMSIAQQPFEGLQVAAIAFDVEVPWVLAEPSR